MWSSLGWFCLGLSALPGLGWLFPLPGGEIFSYYIFTYVFCPFLSLFFWDPYSGNIHMLDVVPWTVLISFHSFFCSTSVISTTLSSTSLICSSAPFTLLLIPYSVFFISIIVCFISVWFFFCGVCSAFKCSFDEFVGEKVVSPVLFLCHLSSSLVFGYSLYSLTLC